LAIYSHAVPANSRSAAKIWDGVLGDAIDAGKKAGAVRTVAQGCTQAASEVSFAERKTG